MTQKLRPPSTPRPAPVLLAIAGLCALLEVVFTLTDSPALDLAEVRRSAILYGAFWPGLLEGWDSLFPGQRVTMFFSYAFLHGGFLHMTFNMLILIALGRQAVGRLGQAGFLLVYLLCGVGAAVAFYVLNGSGTPMLGASGAVFGLFGTQVYWDIQARRMLRLPIDQPLRLVVGLVVMNVLLWVVVGGMLAWEAHLGGFVTGAVLARIITPTPGHRYRKGMLRR